jgi:hypothetical protein
VDGDGAISLCSDNKVTNVTLLVILRVCKVCSSRKHADQSDIRAAGKECVQKQQLADP